MKMRNLDEVVPWSIAAVKVPRFVPAGGSAAVLALVWATLGVWASLEERCHRMEGWRRDDGEGLLLPLFWVDCE